MKLQPSILFLVTLLLLVACTNSNEGPITIEDAWIREAPPGASAMAGYMKISNISSDDLILHSAKSPDFNAIEFHRSVEKDGVWKMNRHLHIHLDANSSVILKPKDYHLMMFSPKRQLKEGDQVDVNLQFSNDINIDVIVPVVKQQY